LRQSAPEKAFPILDALRLLVAHPALCRAVVGAPEFIGDLLARFSDSAMPKAARIMSIRLASNLFATHEGGQFSVAPGRLPPTLKLFFDAINASDVQLRAAAAVLVYNVSLYLPRTDSDEAAQFITSILHQLGQESDLESAYSLLMALAHMIYCNDSGVDLALALGVNLDKWAAGSSPAKVVQVVADLRTLLQPPVATFGQVIHVHDLATFEDHVRGSKACVVDFSASWCGPCKMIAPRYEALAAEYPTIAFLHVDTDECRAIIPEVRSVQGVPTFQFYKSGQRVAETVGANVAEVTKNVHFIAQ